MSFWQLFTANLKIVYRYPASLFWIVAMPVAIYVVISILPIGQFIKTGVDYSTYLLPGVIAMTIMQGGIYALAYWMVDMRARGVIKRFLVTPLRPAEMGLALVAARLVVLLVQVVLLTLVGMIFFHAMFAWNVVSVLIYTALGGSIFLMVGLFISTFAKTYDAAAPITAGIGLPLTFLGNIFYPVSVLPHSLQVLANILPITHLANGLRTAYLEPFAWNHLLPSLPILLAWFAGLLLLVIWRFKLEE